MQPPCSPSTKKPQIQALNRSAPTLPKLPTTPARATPDYQRNGTCDLFAVLNVATGTVITDIRKFSHQRRLHRLLNKVNRQIPAEFHVHVILDNLRTHKGSPGPPLAIASPAVPLRLHSDVRVVDEPRGAVVLRADHQEADSAHRNVKELTDNILNWAANWNENPRPFVWTQSTEQILECLASYCAALNASA